MSREIQRADKKYRRRFLTVYAVLVLIEAGLMIWVKPWAKGAIARLTPGEALLAMELILMGSFLGLAALGAYGLRLGLRIMKHRRLPPPGAKVLVDTRVIQGPEARARGRAIAILAALLTLGGLLGAYYIPRQLPHLRSPGPVRQAAPAHPTWPDRAHLA